ncbi:MAG TPA: hypothetical protein VMU50_03890 [Polyangia bacterium]|nr:hypothetical protein [Polyangia bacterium]
MIAGPGPPSGRALVGGGLIALGVGWSFFAATTFIGDDHVFLTFARLVGDPLVAFVSDQHGGEYYRPVPMALWWLLARADDGAAWPFQLAALILHALVAAETAILARVAGEPRPVAALAGLLFLVAPQNLEAAYWFSASTDLLASAALVGALICVAGPRPGAGRWLASVGLAAVAYLSKESALALPLLALAVLARPPAPGARDRRVWHRPLPYALLAGGFLVARWRVLNGWGGTTDPPVPLAGKLLQLAAGLVHAGTGAAVLPEPLAWGAGAVAMACLLRHVARAPGARAGAAAWQPAAFVALALLPVLAASSANGARYFYLPSVGLAWLGARCLVAAAPATRLLVLGAVVALATAQAARRHGEVADYTARLAAARTAVVDGLAHGHTVFHVAAAIKDIDLALKSSPDVRRADGPEPRLLVLSDVPASFVLLPPATGDRLDFLLAQPPIPPSGFYRFGAARVAGLARRGEEPDLDDVTRRFPDLRFIRLARASDGRVVARDVTGASDRVSSEPGFFLNK